MLLLLLLLLLIGVAWVLGMLFCVSCIVLSHAWKREERFAPPRRFDLHSFCGQGMVSTWAFFSFFASFRLLDCWCSSRRESARCLTLCTAVLFREWVLYLYRKQC